MSDAYTDTRYDNWIEEQMIYIWAAQYAYETNPTPENAEALLRRWQKLSMMKSGIYNKLDYNQINNVVDALKQQISQE